MNAVVARDPSSVGGLGRAWNSHAHHGEKRESGTNSGLTKSHYPLPPSIVHPGSDILDAAHVATVHVTLPIVGVD